MWSRASRELHSDNGPENEGLFSSPLTSEGHGAPKGAMGLASLSARGLRQPHCRKRIAFRRTTAVIFDPASVQFRSGRANKFTRQRISPPSPLRHIPTTAALIVGRTDNPGSPGRAAANRGVQAPHPAPLHDASRSAPHEQDDRNIIQRREMSRRRFQFFTHRSDSAERLRHEPTLSACVFRHSLHA